MRVSVSFFVVIRAISSLWKEKKELSCNLRCWVHLWTMFEALSSRSLVLLLFMKNCCRTWGLSGWSWTSSGLDTSAQASKTATSRAIREFGSRFLDSSGSSWRKLSFQYSFIALFEFNKGAMNDVMLERESKQLDDCEQSSIVGSWWFLSEILSSNLSFSMKKLFKFNWTW